MIESNQDNAITRFFKTKDSKPELSKDLEKLKEHKVKKKQNQKKKMY